MKTKRQKHRPARPHDRPDRPPKAGGSIIYGWHSAVAALNNPDRIVHRIFATENALARLQAMQQVLAGELDCPLSSINIKATTTETLGFIGREEGIAVEAVVVLEPAA